MRYQPGLPNVLKVLFFVSLYASVVNVPIAYGTNSIINASVCSQRPATLEVSDPNDGDIVYESAPSVSGTVDRVSQIMAYVNGVYHKTIALDASSTSFTYVSSLREGDNSIRLVGIDPCSSDGPEVMFSLKYDPKDTPVNPVGRVVDSTVETTEQTQEYLQAQVNEASTSKPAGILSDFGFEIMDALDLIPQTGQQSMPGMFARFWSISAGTALIVLTHPMISLYHATRYRLMEWNVHALPEVVRHHAAFVLRVGGAFLLSVGFFI